MNNCLNRDYIKELMVRLSFPEESIFYLLKCFDEIWSKCLADYLIETIQFYDEDINVSYDLLVERVKTISSITNIHFYSVFMIVFLLMTPRLRKFYEENNIDLEKYYETLEDLKFKVVECRPVKGVWGTFVSCWQMGLFRGEIISFGVLQFELISVKEDIEYQDKKILIGDKILSVHIPRREKPLDLNEVKKEINEAFLFYKDKLTIDAILLDSWLIHPTTVSCLNENSNIKKFTSLFNFLFKRDDEDYSELWRLFDMEVNENTHNLLPNNTSLRRNFIDVIKNKKPFGTGVGILFK